MTSNIISNFIAIDNNIMENNFISSEKKAYLEYIFNRHFNFGLQLKQNIIENSNYISKDNYFYNLFVKYNYFYDLKNEYYILFGYGGAIHHNKELELSSNNDIYNNIFIELSYKIIFDDIINPYNNDFLKINLKYTYLNTDIKNNITFNAMFGKKINLTSLIMFEYIFNYDIDKKLDSYLLKYYSKYSYRFYKIRNLLLSNGHSFNVYFIAHITDNLSFFAKNGIEIFNKKTIYNIGFGFWFQ